MFKKVLMTFGILVLLLTGCTTSEIIKKEPVVFSVLYNNREETPFQEDWLVLEEYKKRQNVVLDVQLGDDKEYGKGYYFEMLAGSYRTLCKFRYSVTF